MSSHLPMLGARATGSLRRDDFHETPEIATQALLRKVDFTGPIWEPACGNGAISRVLEDAGHEVVSTDLVERGYGDGRVDFLMEYRGRAPNIITNPPFKLAARFAQHAHYLTTGRVALLCRLAWLEGQARRHLFERLPLARVLVFSERLPMMHRADFIGEQSTNAIAFAWFVFDRARVGAPVLEWV